MKLWMAALCGLIACASAQTIATVWLPASGHTQIPIWPKTAPDAQTAPGPEIMTTQTRHLVAGRPWLAATNVTRPTITVYAPKSKNSGAAVVVFPGGGFEERAMDLEGTEACQWLT